MPRFHRVHPIIGARDIGLSLRFYSEDLGFKVALLDSTEAPNYAILRRDGVELHMQIQFDYEMSTIRLRFAVEDVDGLAADYRSRGVRIESGPKNTPWNTREFAIHDPDRNGLTFCGAVRPEQP